MADILIRGMEMPHGCDSCKLNANGRGCSITGTKYESDTMVLMDFDEHTQRLKDCPIIELPEHGDLIDASKLIPIYEEMKWSDDYCKECMKGAIWEVEQAPVIVPSNKEETE